MTTVLKGWKFGALVAGLVGGLGLFLYPIAISPMIDASEYSKSRRIHVGSNYSSMECMCVEAGAIAEQR